MSISYTMLKHHIWSCALSIVSLRHRWQKKTLKTTTRALKMAMCESTKCRKFNYILSCRDASCRKTKCNVSWGERMN